MMNFRRVVVEKRDGLFVYKIIVALYPKLGIFEAARYYFTSFPYRMITTT